MQIYWWVMSGLLLFPWSLVLAPLLAPAYRRFVSGASRRVGLKYRASILFVLITVLAGATLAFAAEPNVVALARLRDGTRGLATGWTELFRVIAVETVQRGPVAGFLVGSIGGSHQALSQTTRGIYETVAFFLPVPRPQLAPSESGHLLEVQF